ncbi:MAG: class I SAM-dependent methyltransferase [Methanophagales archaeon]|nr:class I SAM-dependent methyltransferase [Methanophagales archaeon]
MNPGNFYSRIVYFLLGLRDKFGIPFKPREELNKIDIGEGQIILDFGCGIGSYTFPAAELVGNRGRVCALDKQPVAVKRIEEEAKKQGLQNISTILSDGKTCLRDESVDVALLYGVLPVIKDKVNT